MRWRGPDRYRRQIFLSLLDLELHSPAIKDIRTVEDLQALYARRHREIVGIDAVPGAVPADGTPRWGDTASARGRACG